MGDGGSGIPSDSLKANFLDLLESDDSSLERLSEVLKIDTAQFATVCELISHYEQCFEVLSLKKWKYILKRLQYADHFEQLLAAEEMMVDDIGGMDDIATDGPSLAPPKHVLWLRDEFGARFVSSPGTSPIGNQGQRERKFPRRSQSKEFGPKDSKELILSARMEGTFGSQTTTQCPSWSLPLPNKNMKEENTTKDAIEGAGISHGNSKILPNVHSLTQSQNSSSPSNQCENTAVPQVGKGGKESTTLTQSPPLSSSSSSQYENTTAEPQVGKTEEASTTLTQNNSSPSQLENTAASQVARREKASTTLMQSPPLNSSSPSQLEDTAASQVERREKASTTLTQSSSQNSQCENTAAEPQARRTEEASTTLTQSPALNCSLSRQLQNTATSQVERREDAFTPTRPTTPEAPRAPCDPPVTGHRSGQNNHAAQQFANNSNGESGNPAEHYDYTENNGLLTELRKENESLHLNNSFLVQELRKKHSLFTSVRTLCCHQQQQLEESRGQCAQLQRRVDELQRCLRESTDLEQESQRLMRMSQELCLMREQECERLKEHIQQMDQRHDTANCRMENLHRETQEVKEELRSAVGEMQNLRQERHQTLAAELERLRLDYDRQLEEGVAEMTQALANAETDDLKEAKKELAKEKLKRRKTEEEIHRLQAVVRQLSSASGGSGENHVQENRVSSSTGGSCGSCGDDVQQDRVSSSTALIESEADEQPGSVNSSQLSDSDSSDDELFEDACDEFDST